MKSANGKLLVSVNIEQKDEMVIGCIVLKMATLYEKNYREKSPVICQAEEDNDFIRKGQVIICHHNHFYEPSPYFIEGNLYSIPVGKTMFAILNMDGSLNPICGNILCDRINIPTLLEVSPEHREQYINRLIVTDGGWTMYKQGDIVFTRPHSYYEIVYTINGQEHRVHKCDSEMVMGVVKAKK